MGACALWNFLAPLDICVPLALGSNNNCQNAAFKYRRKILNKFRRFLGRSLAKTCLKIDYFGSKTQKSEHPDPRLDPMSRE